MALEYGVLRVEDHCLFLDRQDGSGIEVPVGMVSAVLLEPGVSVTHEAVKLAAEHDVLLLWVGEAGVRVYSAGMPGGKHAPRLIEQVRQHINHNERMMAAQRLYLLMFAEAMPETRSLEKLRGLEGVKVREIYNLLANQYGVDWSGRENADLALKDALGIAASWRSGLAEAVILAAGFSPAIGIIHSGDPRSLAFDLADTVKFKTVVPAAFRVFQESPLDTRNRVRRVCRDMFREQNTASVLFDNLYEILGDDVVGGKTN
ncbi:MAG: type I-E CRISPR-associated endonuclease Cas1 [Opitutaceae bacterium]|nr:type I-E CRISPR-associated endonuclease Cas1 [Opitutaceae bacterium]